uniref:C-type lectin domain-containing protein n=1 Tax=Panagrolaimus superbus TaxID=310955 RepID=A0A914Y6G0_9BILA
MPMLTWDCEMEAQVSKVIEERCTTAALSARPNESTWYDSETYNTIDYYVHEFSKTNIDEVGFKFLSNTTYGTFGRNVIDARVLHDKATKIGCAIFQCNHIIAGKPSPLTNMICTFDVNWTPLTNGTRIKIYEPRTSVSTTLPPVTIPSEIQTTTALNTAPPTGESTGYTTNSGDSTVASTPFQKIVTTTVEPEANNCSPGYIYFEPTHSCYGRDPELGLTWNTWPKAEQYCEKQGGHLASIHSEEENQLIVSLGAIHGWGVWVGLYSVDENYTWKWSDATPIDYVPWFYGYDHPLYPDVNINCVYAYPYYDPRGSLVNDMCNNKQYFVCQLPAQN